MKKITVLILLVFFLIVEARSQTKIYTTSGGEMIFSFATINDNGSEESSTMRWAPWFNIQTMVNFDFTENVGLFSGLGVRNVGYIYDNYTDPTSGDVVKKKFRTYNLALPVGIKLGKISKAFLYGGYEFELPFLYKEKTFQNEKKDKFSVWFSDRVETFQHGFLVGVQLPYGANIKFKYYLSNFHNKDYTETVNGVTVKPYANLDANIFYFSLNFNLFKNAKFDPS